MNDHPGAGPSDQDPNALLAAGRSRETQIRRDAQGRWWNGADPITHPLLTRSFDGWIGRGDDGRFCLRNDINWAYVQIEGPPYFVRSIRMQRPSIDAVTLCLSGDKEEALNPETLSEDSDGSLWCVVGEDLPARFESHAAMQLSPLLVESEHGVTIQRDHGVLQVPRRNG